MKALTFHRPKHVSVEDRPDPTIRHARDAIVRVTATAICGSDLHIYNGFLPQPRPMVLGHELVGTIEAMGPEAVGLRRGDRVVVPFPIACGRCWFCLADLTTHCEVSNAYNYGPEGGTLTEKGGGLFGYTDLYGGYDGGQAQFVRVPFADHGLRKIPDELRDEQVLLLGDVVPTAYAGLRWAGLQPGESVAVWGCGPVGIMAQKLAATLGAGQVIGVDIVPYRLELARRLAGSAVIDAEDNDAVEAVRTLTRGRGADICIDAVGMEVERSVVEKVANAMHAQAGSITAMERCVSAVRRGGRVSILGVYATRYAHFPLGQIAEKGLRVQAGFAPVHDHIDELLEMVESGRLVADDIITHRLPLAEGPRGYELFNRKEDGCVKVVLDPWR